MPQIRLNWCATNAIRSFPLEEGASKLALSGQRLPDNILVGARLKFPKSAGARACLGGVTVTPALVTITIVATNAAMDVSSIVPLAALNIPQPIVVGRPYPIRALTPGVGGWVSFGPGAADVTGVKTWLFTTPAAVPIILAEAAPYKVLPVQGVGFPYTEQYLTGLVKLLGRGDLVIEGADREVDIDDGNGPQTRRVVLFRLNLEKSPDALYEYSGPCGRRPESRTCDFTPIRMINTTRPDANGNINISFDAPFLAQQLETLPYIGVDFPYEMTTVCAALRAKTRPTSGGSSITGGAVEQCDEDAMWCSVSDPDGWMPPGLP